MRMSMADEKRREDKAGRERVVEGKGREAGREGGKETRWIGRNCDTSTGSDGIGAYTKSKG